MILKKFKKNIALALAVITISIPASNVIYANENYNSSQPSISLDQINIDEIHNMFNSIESNVDSKKSNNSNIIEINAEGYSSLVDKTTGNITHIFYKPDGTIDYQYETNFFENLDNMDDKSISPYAIVAQNSTMGPTDALYYKVDRQSRDMIAIKNTKGTPKNYSKEIKTYYTGNTKGFIDNVDRADSYLGKLYSGMGTTAAVAFLAYLGLSTGPIGISVVTKVLTALGLGSLASMATNILNNYNDYTYSTRQANHFYNSI